MRSEVGVIGDIHGDLAKLREIIDAVVADVTQLVFVGDYVDRGPNSAGVIEYLLELESSDVPCTFLAGNHDEAFLDALIGSGFDAFLQMGGAATIRSYVEEIEPDVEEQIRAAVPLGHTAFLAALAQDCLLPSGLFVSHAATMRPQAPTADFCVSGHTPQRGLVPVVTGDAALIDTGCGTWAEGRLTCFFWPSRTWIQAS